MRDLTRRPVELIGEENIEQYKTQRSREFALLLWGRLNLKIDRYQRDGRFFINVVLEDADLGDTLQAEHCGPFTSQPQRDFKAEELVYYACEAAKAYHKRMPVKK